MRFRYVLLAVLIPVMIGLLAVADRDIRLEKSEISRGPVNEPLRATEDLCQLSYTNASIASYFGSFVRGQRIVSLFDPDQCPVSSRRYPFSIESLDLALLDQGDYQWPVTVDLVVFRAITGQSPGCLVPGDELCRETFTLDEATFSAPNVGTLTLSQPCCIEGPAFVGIEYNDPGNGPFPSVIFDDQVADTCVNFFYYGNTWYEWSDIWSSPPPGYPIFWLNGNTFADVCGACWWEPGEPYKMHYPQLPDEAGWDVNATKPMVLADDWQCSETGWVKDIHFWGSWKGGVTGQVDTFWLSIHEDIPAGADVPYSRPGQTLWELPVTVWDAYPVDPATDEGWYDPANNDILPNDHHAYFQYDICLPEDNWFWQEAGTIYWLNISAVIEDPVNTHWGWKSTQNHFNDDAVWATWGDLNWVDLWEPADSIVSSFWVGFDPGGIFLPGLSGGIEPYDKGWYEYESGWWNIWFYDHPFTYDRRKTIHVEFDLFPLEPTLEWYTVVAVNWSTDVWSLEGNPPTEPRVPPLPGTNEELYIGRDTLVFGPGLQGHFSFDYVIPDYNPEWVSIDVMGYNFFIPEGAGRLIHSCEGSLDLSFVVTGDAESPEACCLPDGSCIATTPTVCVSQGGVPQGAGSQCTTPIACCFPDGSCQDLDPLCCIAAGGTPSPNGTANCLGDSNQDGVDDACELEEACCLPDGSCISATPSSCQAQGGTPQGAGSPCTTPVVCCLPDGSCQMLDPLCCAELGGTPSPIGAPNCLGDNDQNGIDDACESGEPDTCDYYKSPYEDYAPSGMPDFDQKQNGWLNPASGQWTWDGPAALANCLWWFDSKYESSPVDPRPFFPSAATPALNDHYPLVQSYDAAGIWDDHDTNNVQPLIANLSVFLQTDAVVPGTDLNLFDVGVVNFLQGVKLDNHYTVETIPGDALSYDFIRTEVMRSQDIILLLGFFEETASGSCVRIGGHYVTVAGVCVDEPAICISDPWLDASEGEPPAGSIHPSGVHNDALNISGPHASIHHDKYFLNQAGSLPCTAPAYLEVVGYPVGAVEITNFSGINPGYNPNVTYSGGPIFTTIEGAVKICPCCVGMTGNVDCDSADIVDISDLTKLVNHLFVTFDPLCCRPEANTSGDAAGVVDISDLTALVNYLFVTFLPMADCP